MSNQTITLWDWWEGATASGQSKYLRIDDLQDALRQTKAGVRLLRQIETSGQDLLGYLVNTKVTTLGEWWDTVGIALHGTQPIFCTLITQLARTNYSRQSFEDHKKGRYLPSDVRIVTALLAVTHLPFLRKHLERAEDPDEALGQLQEVAEEISSRDRDLARLEYLAELFLGILQKLASSPLSSEQTSALTQILAQVADEVENWQLSNEVRDVFSDFLTE